jgi:sulfur carrier protein
MRIVVNGEEIETQAETLDQLLDELGHDHVKVATALNGEHVPKSGRHVFFVAGDRVEIISMRQGG